MLGMCVHMVLLLYAPAPTGGRGPGLQLWGCGGASAWGAIRGTLSQQLPSQHQGQGALL